MTRYWILFFLVSLFSRQIQGQDTLRLDTARTLKEVIVIYQADKLTPITFQNISSKELKIKSTGQEPSFLLAETPSVTNYSDAGNAQGYSYFRLRGIDQTRINISLDGVSLNEPEDQGAYFSNYPDIFNSVSKIQIQRGVGTSKNGVASYGGSVQLFSPNLHDPAKTTVGLGYGSFNSLRAFAEYNSGVKKGKALYVRASEVFSEGYKYNSSNNAQSIFLSSGLFYDKTTWKINLLAGRQQNQLAWLGVPDSLIKIDRRFNANKNERDQFTQCLAQLQNNWQLNRYSSIQSSVYYTFLKGNYDFNLNNFLGLPTTAELYNYAFQSNLVGFFSNYTFSKKQFNLTTGVHGNTYQRRHTGSEKAVGKLYENTGYKQEASTFIKADYSVKRVTLFADVQYRFSSFDYRGSVPFEKIQWQFVNPKAGISVAIKPNSVLYYSAGSTGREPTRNDLFGGNDDLLADSTGQAILSNKTPETVFNQEFGFRHQSQRVNFNLNLYYMDFNNEIVLDGKFGPNGLALTNKVEQSIRAGVELSLHYKLSDHFSLVNNSSFNYSRIKEQKIEFTPILTPLIIINQEVVYFQKGFSVAIIGRYQDESFIDFANTATLENYFYVNARVTYDFKKVQLGIFANNITNTQYFNNGYIDFDGSKKYFVQAPTNFYASIKYSF
ncbi:MAG: TonB-dependent receptor [Saprospiraceae bacterium]|nr:TonB-dependent receptor [Saprospiraceae bacterium]